MNTNLRIQSTKPNTELGFYIIPTIETIDTANIEEIKKLRDDVILQCQGDFVQFESNMPLTEAMIAFDAVRQFCSEVIVKNGDEAFGVYNRHGNDILRPLPTKFVVYNRREFESEDLLLGIQLDLASLWKFSKGDNDYEKINQAVNDALKYYEPARIVTFVGVAPLEVVLALQNMLYGMTAELWYQPTAEPSNQAIKIF